MLKRTRPTEARLGVSDLVTKSGFLRIGRVMLQGIGLNLDEHDRPLVLLVQPPTSNVGWTAGLPSRSLILVKC